MTLILMMKALIVLMVGSIRMRLVLINFVLRQMEMAILLEVLRVVKEPPIVLECVQQHVLRQATLNLMVFL